MFGALKGVAICMVLLIPTSVSVAGEKHGMAAVLGRVESGMMVRGEVSIGSDGSVSALALHAEDELAPAIEKLVTDAAMKWRFAPLVEQGKAVPTMARMSLRLAARQLDDGRFDVSLQNVIFYGRDPKDARSLVSVDITPPRYPRDALRSRAGGSVYLVLKVGRDGAVHDAFAEQVNLDFASGEADQRRYRRMFGDQAVAKAMEWKFRIPTEGELAGRDYWISRVPVSFSMQMSNEKPKPTANSYGQWYSYVRGPREHAPWVEGDDEAGFSPDSLIEGRIYVADAHMPHLLTPLQGS